eukprot:350499-Chlamydomonas_euryale.AAC.12
MTGSFKAVSDCMHSSGSLLGSHRKGHLQQGICVMKFTLRAKRCKEHVCRLAVGSAHQIWSRGSLCARLAMHQEQNSNYAPRPTVLNPTYSVFIVLCSGFCIYPNTAHTCYFVCAKPSGLENPVLIIRFERIHHLPPANT